MASPMSRSGFLPLAIALLALTVVAYLPLGKNGFVDFDDDRYIVDNPHVLAGLSRSGFRWAWTNADANYWLPLTWLSLQLDVQLFGRPGPQGQRQPSAAAVHLHNLFWHASSVVLLFHLGRRLTGARWRSFLIAALFAVHPMHVESVAWAVERKDVLSVFFGLLTLLAYLRYLEAPGVGRYLAMTAAFALSLLSKPMLMTLPFVLLLLDYWPLRRLWPPPSSALIKGEAPCSPSPLMEEGGGDALTPHPDPPPQEGREEDTLPQADKEAIGGHFGPCSSGRLLLEKAPLFGLAAMVALVTTVLRQSTGAALPLSVLPLSARLANALVSYGEYLRCTIYPVHLAVLYPHPGRDWSPGAALAGLAALLNDGARLCDSRSP